uniref:(northern house mosquito) hypothetical protein n=1 Tax=Culex pipiens TaxID=7175 RepID=A0A8D8KM67_CULPI
MHLRSHPVHLPLLGVRNHHHRSHDQHQTVRQHQLLRGESAVDRDLPDLSAADGAGVCGDRFEPVWSAGAVPGVFGHGVRRADSVPGHRWSVGAGSRLCAAVA